MGFFSKLIEDGKSAANTAKDAILKVAKVVTNAIKDAIRSATDVITKSAALMADLIFQEKIANASNTVASAEQKKAARKRQKKLHEWRDVKEPIKFVNQHGKIFCPFCSVPIGGFMVTSTQVKLQDTFQVTAGDRMGAPAPNLVFSGQCLYPTWRIPPPCIGVIQPGMWQDTSQTYIDYYHALLRKSTIPCMISQQDILIVHSGQKAIIPAIKIRSIDTRFKVHIKKIYKDDFVPLGIVNYQKTDDRSSDKIKIKFRIKYQAAKQYEIQIYDKDMQLIWQEIFLQGVTINAERKKGQNSLIFHDPQDTEETYPVGDYTYEWDGFDVDGIYDSERMNGELTFKILGKSYYDGKESEDEDTVEISRAIKQARWVDVVINKNTKKIDVTLRVNLKDGGAFGLDTGYVVAPDGARVSADWEKIPTSEIKKHQPIIKTLIRDFSALESLALNGINYHWGRNDNNSTGKNVQINNEYYQVFINAINTTQKSMDDINLIFNTNGDVLRSGNPGTITSVVSAIGNLFPERIVYNVGYLNYVDWYEVFSNDWGYNTTNYEDVDFKETSAHEIGHEILKTFGGTDYSYRHKGTSTITQVRLDSLLPAPSSGEIDLMKYWEYSVPLSLKPHVVAAKEDVLGLLWLIKLEID